jgi:hypothetical protein
MSASHAQVMQLTKMLKNMERWLDKAEEYAASKGFEPEVLLQSRLAPDMYTLMRQIQSACDGAKALAARLAGKTPPKHPDTEQSYAEIRQRIRTVLHYLAEFGAADFSDADKRIVPLPFMPGKGMAGSEFTREMNVPNTYFHLSMAYAILRHNGVPLTKADYIGQVNLVELE